MQFSKKNAVSVAVATVLGVGIASPSQAIVLTFADNLTGTSGFDTNPDTDGASNTTGLPVYYEFRMIDPGGSGGGGPPISAKDIITGGETWSFNSSNLMTDTSGFPGNVGATAFPGSAAPTANTNVTTGNPAPFFGNGFNFIAPTTGSLAAAAYGTATIGGTFTSSAGTNGTIWISMPVLEAQWAGVWFPLGLNDAIVGSTSAALGVNFHGDVTCVGNGINCSFRLRAQETINKSGNGHTGVNEDPSAAGFGNWTAQWDLIGTIDDISKFDHVPIPAAAWLFGSGLLGLVGVARRRKSK